MKTIFIFNLPSVLLEDAAIFLAAQKLERMSLLLSHNHSLSSAILSYVVGKKMRNFQSVTNDDDTFLPLAQKERGEGEGSRVNVRKLKVCPLCLGIYLLAEEGLDRGEESLISFMQSQRGKKAQ